MNRHVAFLRGINVGGHHKVPMADLRQALEALAFKNVVTLLNSGNVIFDSIHTDEAELEKLVSEKLEASFGFPIPTLIRSAESIQSLFHDAPFKEVEVHKDIRLYVSFIRKENESDLVLPWLSADKSYQITEARDQAILSILDLSKAKTPQAMEIFEKTYGKDVTTRNWKTIERIASKL